MFEINLDCVLNGEEANSIIAWFFCTVIGGVGAIVGLIIATIALLLINTLPQQLKSSSLLSLNKSGVAL